MKSDPLHLQRVSSGILPLTRMASLFPREQTSSSPTPDCMLLCEFSNFVDRLREWSDTAMPVAPISRPAHLWIITDNSAAGLTDGGTVGHSADTRFGLWNSRNTPIALRVFCKRRRHWRCGAGISG